MTTRGLLPPLTAAGQNVYAQRVAARRAGDTTFDGTTWCAGAGIPRLMVMDSPFQIVLQPNDTVFFYFQWNRWARLVHVTSTRLPVVGTSSMGVPTGHWEGNTLVIDSEGFRPDTLLDDAGLPHSAQLHVTERLRITKRDVLENRITITDPAFYSQPWDMRLMYQRQAQTQIVEHVCLDHAPGHSLGGDPEQ